MLKMTVHPKNAENVRKAVKVEPVQSRHGYDRAFSVSYFGHVATLEICDAARPVYVLTVQDVPGVSKIAVTFTEYTPDGLTIDTATVYKNADPYGRTYSAPRYLKKYLQLSCMVHGLITNGDTETTPTTEETPETIPARPEKDPEQSPTTRTDAESPTEKPQNDHRGRAKCYNVSIYITPDGVRRADIRTTTGRPWLDIPAVELDAIRAEIEKNAPGRVSFTFTEETPTTAHGETAPKVAETAGAGPETVRPSETTPGPVNAAENGNRATDRRAYAGSPRNRHKSPQSILTYKTPAEHITPYRAKQNRIRADTGKPA